MSNQYTAIVNLGADPETIQLGEKEGRKLRVAEKAPGKKSVTRWMNLIVTGYDAETADRLRKGDTIAVTGQLVRTEYKPKKPRYKGEMVQTDEIPFCKLMQVIKSPTFFSEKPDEASDEPADTGVSTPDAPDLGGGDDPFAGV